MFRRSGDSKNTRQMFVDNYLNFNNENLILFCYIPSINIKAQLNLITF